jgi:hypothetical protein
LPFAADFDVGSKKLNCKAGRTAEMSSVLVLSDKVMLSSFYDVMEPNLQLRKTGY